LGEVVEDPFRTQVELSVMQPLQNHVGMGDVDEVGDIVVDEDDDGDEVL
jgi:hypothetical protein